MSRTLVLESRFNGPPGSANGGYACGRIAQHLAGDGEAEVTLRLPPPLDTPLAIADADGRLTVRDEGGRLVAEAEAVELELELPAVVAFAEAADASRRYVDREPHPFPTCFVCGPARAEGDGLRLRPGALGDDLAAAPWIPDAWLAGADGIVRPEFHWAALDCPGAFAVDPSHARGLSVLGRLAVRVLDPVRAGESCAVAAWPLGGDGRKRYAGTAIFGECGRVSAFGRATWILLERN